MQNSFVGSYYLLLRKAALGICIRPRGCTCGAGPNWAEASDRERERGRERERERETGGRRQNFLNSSDRNLRYLGLELFREVIPVCKCVADIPWVTLTGVRRKQLYL